MSILSGLVSQNSDCLNFILPLYHILDEISNKIIKIKKKKKRTNYQNTRSNSKETAGGTDTQKAIPILKDTGKHVELVVVGAPVGTDETGARFSSKPCPTIIV